MMDGGLRARKEVLNLTLNRDYLARDVVEGAGDVAEGAGDVAKSVAYGTEEISFFGAPIHLLK
jgi:hypothetical protein